MIPCSDAFGVDLLIEKFEKQLAANSKAIKDNKEALLKKNPVLLKSYTGYNDSDFTFPKAQHKRFIS